MLRTELQRLGIKPVFKDYANLTATDIERLQSLLVGQLPSALGELMLNFGVSTFPGLVTVRGADGREYAFSVFYGGTGARATYDVFRNQRVLADQLPANLLAFAMDEFGNQYCITVADKEPGSVVYWESESGNVHKVASSLEDLLKRMEIRQVG